MKEIITIDLDKIFPNPFQTRESEDPEHVAKIAASIEAEGLLQIPVARPKMDTGGMELAFGHTRLAAFKKLAAEHPEDQRWAAMPLMLRDLGDEDLFRLAVSENLARKDLNGIEEARAMAIYRDHFKKNSAEIGALFGLADSSVRNKLRLLQLPADLAAELLTRGVSERVCRELLVLFDMPAEFIKNADDSAHWIEYKPKDIISEALDGATAEWVENRITTVISTLGCDLSSAPWKHDEIFQPVPYFVSETCKECPLRVMRGKRQMCLDKVCYGHKRRSWTAELLEKAALASGIPAIEDPETYLYDTSNFYYEAEREQAVRAGCENLRLVYDLHSSDKDVPGHPGAVVTCSKRRGMCTCVQALKAKVELGKFQQAKEAEVEAVDGLAFGYVAADGTETVDRVIPAKFTARPALTADDLKEVSRQVKRQRRENLENVKLMRKDVAAALETELQTRNYGAWYAVAEVIFGSYSLEKRDLDTYEKVIAALAEKVTVHAYEWYEPSQVDPGVAADRLNRLLAKCGLEPLKMEAGEA